jgi:hypothetical protein
MVDLVEGVLRYKQRIGDVFTVGALPYAKDMGKRGKTLGVGAEIMDSKLTLTVRDPSINWMKDVGDTQINLRLGVGGRYGDGGQVIVGVKRRW